MYFSQESSISFRLQIQVPTNGSSPRKCYVSVKKNWTQIQDLEAHIESLFSLGRIELLVNNAFLPSQESIELIQPNDELIVKLKSDGDCRPSKSHCHGEMKRKYSKAALLYGSMGHALRQLSGMNLPPDGANNIDFTNDPVSDADNNATIVQAPTEENTLEQFDASGTPISNKESPRSGGGRKRKRKRKSNRTKDVNHNSSKDELREQSVTDFRSNSSISGSHLRFQEEDVELEETTSEHRVSDPDETQEFLTPMPAISDDWRENLLGLKKLDKKCQFIRKCSLPTSSSPKAPEDNSCQLPSSELLAKTSPSNVGNKSENISVNRIEPSQYPIIKSTKVKDILLFKKLKLGNDFCPTISDYLLGEVASVEETTNDMMIQILDGFNELSMPEGCLTGQRPPNSSSNFLQINWSEMIEPRLVFP